MLAGIFLFYFYKMQLYTVVSSSSSFSIFSVWFVTSHVIMRLWLLEHKFSEERLLELTKFSGQLTYKSLKILDPVINKSKGFFFCGY